MRRYSFKLCLAAGLLLLLTGCFSQTVDELYAPPRAPDDYLKLDNKINEVLNQGGEYAAPVTGELTQKVQLQDLDGDGVKEAIAFFRVNADEKPLKVCIYHQVGEEYELTATIESAGTAIDSVYYENLDDSPCKEIVVSWQTSEKVHSLAAYSIDHAQVLELMRTTYSDFRVFDLDSDGQKELIVVHSEETEGESRVELYNLRDGVLELDSSAPLSGGGTGLTENGVRTGLLRDSVPAVFVSSTYGEKKNGYITDIFAWRAGRIENITLKPATGESSDTIRWYTDVSATDINGDGILELPDPYGLPDPKSNTTAVNFWAIRWRQFDVNGTAWPVYTTYHNNQDGWYFILPDRWEGKLTISRSNTAGGGERAVIFSYWEGDETVEPKPFLVLYKLTGDNRFMWANMTGRFRLDPVGGDENEALYAARLIPDNWDCGLKEEDVRTRFALIVSDWTSVT